MTHMLLLRTTRQDGVSIKGTVAETQVVISPTTIVVTSRCALDDLSYHHSPRIYQSPIKNKWNPHFGDVDPHQRALSIVVDLLWWKKWLPHLSIKHVILSSWSLHEKRRALNAQTDSRHQTKNIVKNPTIERQWILKYEGYI